MITSDKVLNHIREGRKDHLDHEHIFSLVKEAAQIIADDCAELGRDIKFGNNVWNYCRNVLITEGFHYMKKNGFKELIHKVIQSKKSEEAPGVKK